MVLNVLQGAAALLGLILFGFLFPNLRFFPARIGWLAVPLSFGLMLMLSGILGSDDLFPIIMLLLLFALLVGAGSQVFRYRRQADAVQRRQTGAVVAALALLPACFILSFLLNDPGWPSLINLHIQVLIAALLPIALLESVLRRGLWANAAPMHSKPPRPLWTGLLAATMLGFAVLAAGLILPIRPERLQFDPLPARPDPRPVIIDTDMAPDDWMAILFILQRPEIEVKAITVTGAGEAHCEPGVQNALGLAALSGNPHIPVACGRETPLQGQNVFPEEWRLTADDMAGLALPVVELPPHGQDAVTLIARVLEQSPQKVTVLALGPLTNLGDGVQKDPGFLSNVEMVYIMGGALNVMGNVGFSGIPNQVAEWNIYIDPLAAQTVFESGAPLTLVPLDATNQVPLDMDFYRLLRDNRGTAEADFVYQLLQNRMGDLASGMIWFWDPLAAGLLADESLGYVREGRVKIYPAPGSSSGLTRLHESGVPMRYAVSADRRRFELEFLRALNQP
jgi:pyrimidine-specific ribonucleoside hydrolase